jgi:hypothetical protein
VTDLDRERLRTLRAARAALNLLTLYLLLPLLALVLGAVGGGGVVADRGGVVSVMAITCPMCGSGPANRCRTKDGMSVAVAHAARRHAAAALVPQGRAWCASCCQTVPASRPGRLDFHDKAQGQVCPGSDMRTDG